MYNYNTRRPPAGLQLNGEALELVGGPDFFPHSGPEPSLQVSGDMPAASLAANPYVGANARYWGMGPERENPAAAPAGAAMAVDDAAQVLLDGLPRDPAYTGAGGSYLGAVGRSAAAAADVDPEYQQDGMKFLSQYLNVPFTKDWRRQFWEAPLGGWVRRGAEGLGFDPAVAAGAERIVAGLAATGIGVPAFLAAVNGLSGGSQVVTPQTPGTIPLA